VVDEFLKVNKWLCLVIAMCEFPKMRKEAFPEIEAQDGIHPTVFSIVPTVSLT
jgi:hypothetical protein